MVIRIRKRVLTAIGCIFLFAVVGIVISLFISLSKKVDIKMVAGGLLYSSFDCPERSVPAAKQEDDSMFSQRFQRPSKELPYPNPYSFQDFEKEDQKEPRVTKKFETPEDLILAYYGILREASNMLDYSGGCGTIGWSTLPYPYAYDLLTKEKQSKMTLDQFVESFHGIGYITLLKMIPAYAPVGTPDHTKYYMVEIEVITGEKESSGEDYHQGSRFAYYYGLVTTHQSPDGSNPPKGGWKIADISYIPEDFLCAPLHSWFYLSDAVVQIVYGNNLKLIDRIDETKQNGDIISIYASGNGSGSRRKYRFDFVRLTNGYDILIHEYIIDQGVWKETDLLTDDWRYMKLMIGNMDKNSN